jgi:hypothetical protein
VKWEGSFPHFDLNGNLLSAFLSEADGTLGLPLVEFIGVCTNCKIMVAKW